MEKLRLLVRGVNFRTSTIGKSFALKNLHRPCFSCDAGGGVLRFGAIYAAAVQYPLLVLPGRSESGLKAR